MEPDFIIHDHGTIAQFFAQNDAAKKHLAENADAEGWQWMGNSLSVDPRCAPDLSANLCRDGFAVRLPNGRVVTAEDLR